MIRCEALHIKQGTFKLENINFSISQGEYVVLMGATGSGKTTILEAICGLRKIKDGKILLDGKDISSFQPGQREIGYVPQDSALFSNMTVAQNIGLALKIRKWPKQLIEDRINELASLINITHLLARDTANLSGGEKQRVAFARALSFKPKVICLDEPLSALDDATKNDMYALILKLKEALETTFLHISHSKLEAEKLADRVVYLHKGEVTGVNNLEASQEA